MNLDTQLQAMIVSARVEEAEIAWREAGFDDGRPDGNGVAIKLPLDTFKHAIACVSGYSFRSSASVLLHAAWS